MFETLLLLIVLGVFVGGIVLVIRIFTLPGEIRRVQHEVGELKREVISLDARLAAAHKKIDQLSRGEAPTAVSHPEPKPEVVTTPHSIAPGIEIVREEEEAAEVFAEEVAPAMFRASEPADTPPPLPARKSTPPPPVYSAPPEPSESAFAQVLKALGPKDKNMTWEVALGTFWLPRLGALALSTALVFLLTIGFQRLGAPARVAMGYGVAAALLGLGWWLDRKYPKYARVLFGAGFAMTYFVTFATYFVEFAKIFTTPYVTLAGLAAIVAGWAGLAQWRKSPVIAGIAMLVGQFTIFLATATIENPGPYSILGIVFLSIGGAFFLARNGWYAVAGLGLVASYANHFYLMREIESTGAVGEFVTGMAVLSTYFLVYAAAEFLSPEAIRRRVPFWFRNAFVAFNSIMFLLYGTMTMQGFDFTRDVVELFHYALAAALLAFSIAYLRLRDRDLLHNTYFVKSITAATLGLAMQFDAHTLTASLAIECALLLFAARRTGLIVTRLVALAAGALAIAQGGWTLLMSDSIAYGAEGFFARFAEAGVVLVSLFGAALLYQRTDWSTRSPARLRFSDATNFLLWQFDLVAAPPSSVPNPQKPLQGLLFPFVLATSAALLYAGQSYRLTIPEDWAVALAAGAFTLSIAAWTLRSLPFGAAALMLYAMTTGIASLLLGDVNVPLFWENPDAARDEHALLLLLLMSPVAVFSETRFFGRYAGLALHRQQSTPYLLYGAVAWLIGLHFTTSIASPAWSVGALMIAAAIFAALAIPLHRLALAWCSTALIAWAAWHWNLEWSNVATREYLAMAWIGIAAAFALELYFARLGVKYAGDVLIGLAAFLFVPYVFHEAPREWIALGWTLGAAAFLAYGGLLRNRTAVAIGVAILAAASLRQAIYTQGHAASTASIILGFAAAAALWIAIERTANRLAGRMSIALPASVHAPLCGIAAGLATALLVLMLYRLPQLAEFYLTVSWSILAMALFGLAIAFREKLYRYCGLAVLALASVRVVAVDTRELELIQRVLAWGGLGIVLLILGFGYVKVFTRDQNADSANAQPKD